MALPILTPSTITREEAIAGLIESVALEEAGLSNILNAQGDNIRIVSNLPNVTPAQMIAITNSVQSTISTVSHLEIILQSKLDLFSGSFVV